MWFELKVVVIFIEKVFKKLQINIKYIEKVFVDSEEIIVGRGKFYQSR